MKTAEVFQHSTHAHRSPGAQGRTSFRSAIVVSALVHALILGGVIGSAWLFRGKSPLYLKPSSQTVILVDAPFTRGEGSLGGGGEERATHHDGQETGGGEPPGGDPATEKAEAPSLPLAKMAPGAPKSLPLVKPEMAAPPTPLAAKPEPVVPKTPEVAKATPVAPKTPPVSKPEAKLPPPVVAKPEPVLPKTPAVAKPEPPPQKTPATAKAEPPLPQKAPATAKVEPPPQKAPVAPKVELPPQKSAPVAPKVVQKDTKPVASAKTPSPEETNTAAVQQEARLAVEKLREKQQRHTASQQQTEQDQQNAKHSLAVLRARHAGAGGGEDAPAAGVDNALRTARVAPTTDSGGTAAGSAQGRGVGVGPGSGAGPGSGPGGSIGSGGGSGGGLRGVRLQSYTGRIKLMIERAWLPPSRAASNLRAVVHLTIDKQGRVEQLRVVQSSGNTMFDQSLVRAIKQVSPLPPPPEDPNEPSLEAVIQFRQPS